MIKYISSYNDFVYIDININYIKYSTNNPNISTLYIRPNGIGNDIIPVEVSCNETKNKDDVYRFSRGYYDAYLDLRTRLKQLELDNQLFIYNNVNDLTNLEMLDSVLAGFNSLDLIQSNNKIVNKQSRQVIEYNTNLILNKKNHLKISLF
jgi:hypothetical protein